MSTALSVVLPTHLRRRGETVGLLVGAWCFPMAFFAKVFGAVLPDGPAGIALPIVLLSALAGGLGCALGRGPDVEADGSFAVRVGIRAGMVAALIGGALTVFAATLHAFGLGQAAVSASRVTIWALVLPHSRPFQVLVLSLLALPPAAFFGLTGALLVAVWNTPSVARANRAQPKLLMGALLAFVLAFSASGYLSPFTLPLRPKPQAPVVARAVPAVAPTPPPKWRYRKPAGLDTANASQILFSEQRTFEGVNTHLPIALSPDEILLAYFVQSSGWKLEVRELDTMEVIVRAEVLAEPSALAWSPDAQRLLVISAQGEARRLQVCRVVSSQVLTLPLPRTDQLPASAPRWWNATEIVFWEPGTAKILDLETLRVVPAHESNKWKALSKEQQAAILHPEKNAAFPANHRWQMKARFSLRRYRPPLEPLANWTVQNSLALTMHDPARAYHHVLFPTEIDQGDLFLAPRDGTKLLHFRQQTGTVYYLGLREPLRTNFQVTMPSQPEAALDALVAKRQLCAFICAPVINPLNGRTVGPDRNRVKALARFATWKEQTGQLWMEESYQPVQPGDVLTDLHAWEDHRPRTAGAIGSGEWFTVIEQWSGFAPLTTADAPPLERQFDVVLDHSRTVPKLERVVAIRRPQVSEPPKEAPPGTAQKATGIPAAGAEPEAVATLTAFITEHHAKSSRGDVEGLLASYAAQVDHFNNGFVDREFIRGDELRYHSPGTQVTERIVQPPTISRLGGRTFAASYTISFHRVGADDRWTSGYSDVELQIELTPEGPRIVRQRARVRDQQKGRR